MQGEQEDKKQIKEQYEKMIQETKQEVILVMFVFLNYFNYYMCILGYIDIDTIYSKHTYFDGFKST